MLIKCGLFYSVCGNHVINLSKTAINLIYTFTHQNNADYM